MAVHQTNVLESTACNKSCQGLCSQDVQIHQKSTENISTSSYLLSSLTTQRSSLRCPQNSPVNISISPCEPTGPYTSALLPPHHFHLLGQLQALCWNVGAPFSWFPSPPTFPALTSESAALILPYGPTEHCPRLPTAPRPESQLLPTPHS